MEKSGEARIKTDLSYSESRLQYLCLYRVSQKTWEFSDELDIVFVMN